MDITLTYLGHAGVPLSDGTTTVAIATANDTTVFEAFEICNFLAEKRIDPALLGEICGPDISLIPIRDRFTMGPELATRAAETVKPTVAVPIHYKTWPLLAPDASGFTPKGVEIKELEPGEAWPYGH